MGNGKASETTGVLSSMHFANLEFTPSAENAKTGLGAERNQIRKNWRKRDRSLFARFMHSKAMPMTQKEVFCKCAMMPFSP